MTPSEVPLLEAEQAQLILIAETISLVERHLFNSPLSAFINAELLQMNLKNNRFYQPSARAWLHRPGTGMVSFYHCAHFTGGKT